MGSKEYEWGVAKEEGYSPIFINELIVFFNKGIILKKEVNV